MHDSSLIDLEKELKLEIPFLDIEELKKANIGFSKFNEEFHLKLDTFRLNIFPESLSTLVDLTHLSIAGCGLTNISGIDKLTSLVWLDIGYNELSSIDELGSLCSLQHLDLSENKVSNGDILGKLRNLVSLDLSLNNLSSVAPIKELKKLTRLSLWGNFIKDFSLLSGLKGLLSLDLFETKLKNIDFLNTLTELEELDLGRNLIRDVSAIRGLNKLKILNLSYNKISDITPLSELLNLEELIINDNKIKSVDPFLGLEELRILQVSGNKIREFPKWLTRMRNGGSLNSPSTHGFGISRNPITNVPAELLRLESGAILDYFISLENGAEPINEIKVTLLGEGAAGKTSLMNYLQGKPFNKNESQTHGINLTDCINESGVTLKIWDFGGQDIMHHTHQFFLTQKSVYVLVLNARENSDTEKWLKLIQVFGGDSPIIIVTNKIDENPSEHENIKYLNTKYHNLRGRYVRISCETGEGLEEFKVLLADTIKSLLHVRTRWGNSWLRVKRELESMRNEEQLRDYIHMDRYEEICNSHSVPASHRETLLIWLHELGIITYFSDPNLSETNVINPSWITEGFYSIINSKKVAERFGKFSFSDLPEVLDSSRYPKHKHSYLLGLMTKFELCYQINSTTFLIPDLLNKEEPDFDFNTDKALRVKIKYTALIPKAVLPKFMVRRHLEILNQANWRTGMLIGDNFFASQALIRVDEEDKEISVFVKGREKKGYLSSIISSLESINKLYEGLEYEILVPCTCALCRKTAKPYFFKYDILVELKERGRKTYPCERSFQDVPINDLLGLLITQAELELEVKKVQGKTSSKVKECIEKKDISGFVSLIKSLFNSVSYLLFEKSEKAYHTPLFILLRAIFGSSVRADEVQNKGRADIIIEIEEVIYILELKLDGDAEAALKQIHDKKYYDPYLTEEKEVILLGINFSSELRNIDEVRHEVISPLRTENS